MQFGVRGIWLISSFPFFSRCGRVVALTDRRSLRAKAPVEATAASLVSRAEAAVSAVPAAAAGML